MVLRVVLNFYLTWKCNLQCDHCQYHCHPNETKQMTDEQIQYGLNVVNTIMQSQANQIVVIGLTGGEPMLHPRFWYVAEALNSMRQRYKSSFPLELHTNGTQPISEETISQHPHIFDTAFIGCDAYHDAQKQNLKWQSLSKVARQIILRRSMIQSDINTSWVRLIGRGKEKFENQSQEIPSRHCMLAPTETQADVCFTPDCIKFCGEIGRGEYMPHNTAKYMDPDSVNETSLKILLMKALEYSIYHTGSMCSTPCMYKLARVA
jgi:hypothetical protein